MGRKVITRLPLTHGSFVRIMSVPKTDKENAQEDHNQRKFSSIGFAARVPVANGC